MGLRLKNSSGNYVELNAPSSIASDFSLTLPNTDGDASQFLQTDGAGALSWQTVPNSINEVWTNLGSTTTTGASTFEVTGISTAAKHIKILVDGFSSSSSSGPQFGLRLGNGSIDSGGSGSNYKWITSSGGVTEYSTSSDSIRLVRTGFNAEQNAFSGVIDIYKAGTNVVVSWLLAAIDYGTGSNHGGAVWSGSSSIDRVQLIVPTGHNADAGYFSVFYEAQP